MLVSLSAARAAAVAGVPDGEVRTGWTKEDFLAGDIVIPLSTSQNNAGGGVPCAFFLFGSSCCERGGLPLR